MALMLTVNGRGRDDTFVAPISLCCRARQHEQQTWRDAREPLGCAAVNEPADRAVAARTGNERVDRRAV
jgi:hypothetical protein